MDYHAALAPLYLEDMEDWKGLDGGGKGGEDGEGGGGYRFWIFGWGW